MPIQNILESIDQEISQLQRARALLAGHTNLGVPGKRRGRPKGSTNKPPSGSLTRKAAKRTISPEGKARIAAAQKARWTKQRRIVARAKKTANAPSAVPEKKSAKTTSKKVSANKAAIAKKTSPPTKSIIAGRSASASTEASKA